MDPNNETDNFNEIAEIEADDSVSVDDFIKQLEENLHIVPDSVIEVDEGEFDDSLTLEPLFNTSAPESKARPEAKPAEAPPTPKELPDVAVAEITELKAKIAKMEKARRELLLDSQRRLKDFEAYRKRTERERNETFTNQVGNLAQKMLPALDNLNRALDFATELSEKPSEFQQFFEGIVLVNQQVNEVFAGMGVVPIKAVGSQFDPHLHEAVAIDESEDVPPNTISAELLRGYRIGDKVIRHSMVKVSRASAQSEPLPPPETVEPEPETGSSVSDTDSPESVKDFILESSAGEVIGPESDPQQ